MDTDIFAPGPSALAKKLGLNKDNTIVFVGRLIEMKGIRIILTARELIRKKGHQYNYLFEGFDRQNDPQLVSLVKSGKDDIILLEDLERDRVPEAFNAGAIATFMRTVLKLPISFLQTLNYGMILEFAITTATATHVMLRLRQIGFRSSAIHP
ncbi:MAG: glycosyltransferase [Candidatus Woesearchaeota archaeon]